MKSERKSEAKTTKIHYVGKYRVRRRNYKKIHHVQKCTVATRN